MPVCEEYGVNMCVHPDDPNDINWILNAVDNSHNGLTLCTGSLSAGLHNDVPVLASKFSKRTHFVHLRSTNILENGDFIESSQLDGRGRFVEVIRVFEKENPGLPMRIDHGRLTVGGVS